MIPPNIQRILRKRRQGKRLTPRERAALQAYVKASGGMPAPPRPPAGGGGGRPVIRRPNRKRVLPPGLRPGRMFPGRRLFARQAGGLCPLYTLPDDED